MNTTGITQPKQTLWADTPAARTQQASLQQLQAQAQASAPASAAEKIQPEASPQTIGDTAPEATKSSPTLLAKMTFYQPARSSAAGSTAVATPQTAAQPTNQPNAVAQAEQEQAQRADSSQAPRPYTGCDTCQSRQYQDGSDDAGVSFQSPTHIPTSMAGVAVASHEGEHVTRETAKAESEGRMVVHKTVTFQMGSCPECNRMYIAGGTTSITTADAGENQNADAISALDLLGGLGDTVDTEV